MKLLEEQKRGINTIDKDICVSASAGSGKTLILVERYLNILINKLAKPSEILAITFTNKACFEMRKRIIERLQALNELSLIKELSFANISTIHSFCSKLLREFIYVLEIGIKSDFRICDENEARLHEQDLAKDLFICWEKEKPKQFNLLLNELANAKTINPSYFSDPYAAQFISLYNKIISSGKDLNEISSENPISRSVLEFIVDFKNQYIDIKTQRNILTYNDLEYFTKKIISENAIIKKELSREFKYILVDEFQDTNKLQREIIEGIRGNGNLFTVGDLKQSIYEFRGANSNIFKEEIDNTIKKNGDLIHLDKTFRTRPEIVSFTNYIFNNVWGAEFFRDVESICNFKKVDYIPVEFIISKHDKIRDARRNEAYLIAKKISEIIENSKFVITNEQSNEFNKKITYSDIAILVRTTTDLSIYKKALQAFNLPYVTTIGRGFYNSFVIVDILNLLKILQNPYDNITLLATLSSPLFNFSMNDIALLSSNRNKQDTYFDIFYDANKDQFSKELSNKVKNFLNIFEYLTKIKNSINPSELILQLLKKTSYESYILEIIKDEEEYLNLRKLINKLRELEKTENSNLTWLISYLERNRMSLAKEASAPRDTVENAINLLTIHQAKGLEFSVVIITDIGRRKTFYKNNIICFDEKEGLGFKFYNKQLGTDEATLEFNKIIKKNEISEKKEYERLLYVAMTRAKDYLILSSAISKSKPAGWLKTFLDILNLEPKDLIKNELILDLPQKIKLRVTISDDISDSSEKKKTPQISLKYNDKMIQQIHNDNKLSDNNKYSYGFNKDFYNITEILQFNNCPQKYYFDRILGLGEIIRANERQEVFSTTSDGAQFGTVVHNILEKYNEKDRTSNLESLIKEELKKENLSDYYNKTKEMIQGFYDHELGKKLIRSKEIYKEFSFATNLLGVNLLGTIDLIFKYDSSFYLIDYKTDFIESNQDVDKKAQYYRLQLVLYTLAVKNLFPNNIHSYLFFLAKGIEEKIRVKDNELKFVEESINNFKENLAMGTFHKKINPNCNLCNFNKICLKA